MAQKADTRTEIMRTAARLLQTRGFNGFSYGHVAEALGIKPAAVHYHFPSKTDLGIALVQRFRARYEAWMDDAVDLPPWEKLEGFFKIYERFLDDGRRACPAGVLQAELDAIPDEMQLEVRRMVGSVHRWVASMLDSGREAGSFRFEGPAEDLAALVVAGVQGALQAARVMGKEPFLATKRQIWRLLGGELA